MSIKKNFRQRQALAEARGLAQVAESYMTAALVLSGLDTASLPESAQGHIKTALNVMAYTVSDIGTKYQKTTGQKLDLTHIEQSFLIPSETPNEQAE